MLPVRGCRPLRPRAQPSSRRAGGGALASPSELTPPREYTPDQAVQQGDLRPRTVLYFLAFKLSSQLRCWADDFTSLGDSGHPVCKMRALE